MSLRINTNVAALNAYNNLSMNQSKLEGAFSQLSSGLRINKAADDAAGLSISQGLTSQINGLTQAVSNAQDGINVAQIADGALGTVQDILQRMRTLVVQAGNTGTQDSNSIAAISKEVQNLNGQLNNIAGQTKFGATNLLDGSFNKSFQVGSNGGDTLALNLGTSATNAYAVGATYTAPTGAQTVGTYSGGTDLTSLKIAGGTTTFDATTAVASTSYTTPTSYSTSDTSADLTKIDNAIKAISTARSTIGAVQNQLNYTVTNLQTAVTNVTASRSNLTDADLATQVTKMTQQQILTSAATSVLAQANSAPQAILKLLR